MAIYKPPKARWPLALFTGIAALLLGVALGFLLGKEDPDAAEGVRLVQQELTAAAAGLEVAGIEYSEAVEGGEVVNETEYQGSLDALESSKDRFESVAGPLGTLAPDLAERIEGTYGDARNAMEERAAAEEVDALLGELSELLKGETTR